MQHFHNLHKEAVKALRETAEEMGMTYEDVKKRFTMGNLNVTKKFWEMFKSKNNVNAIGIDYCHGCKKFNVHIA